MQNYFQILKFHAPQIDAELRFGLIVDQTKQFWRNSPVLLLLLLLLLRTLFYAMLLLSDYMRHKKRVMSEVE